MAININQNEIYDKIKKKHGMFADAEVVKKDLENERRILRIQQVRKESNNLARRIRKEVDEEKNRQLRRLENIKQKELDCWRRNVLVKKHHDYRSAVFQVGAAHQAAEVENQLANIKKQQRLGNVEMRRNQKSKTLKCKETRNTKEDAQNNENIKKNCVCCVCKSSSKSISASKSTKSHTISDTNTCAFPNTSQQIKRKRNICCCRNHKCCCRYSDESDSDLSTISLDSTSSFHLESENQNVKNNKNAKLKKTPPVILDVEIRSDESLVITTQGPIEINDRHVKTNRQFCRLSDSQSNSNNGSQAPKEPSHSVIVTDDTEMATTSEKSVRPRFTQISDFLKKTAYSEKHINTDAINTTNNSQPQSTNKLNENNTFKNSSEQTNFNDQNVNTNISAKTLSKSGPVENNDVAKKKLPSKIIQASKKQKKSTLKSAKCKGDVSLSKKDTMITSTREAPPPPSTANATPDRVANAETTVASSTQARSTISTATVVMHHLESNAPSTNSGRVKFFDYNNKFHKDYEQSSKSVQVNVESPKQLTAMDHADIENKLQELRKQEVEKLRKIAEERGIKALEREQIRRDCAELTEKLDALSRQHPQMLVNDANFVPSHRFADLAARREKKMDEKMEKMLLQPAVITCPEVPHTPTSASTNNIQSLQKAEIALNVGDRVASLKEGSTISSDSCTSIILDCINSQQNQLRTDLQENNTNEINVQRLKTLLDRVEKIRDNLLKELKCENSFVDSKNLHQVINSISQERSEILNVKEKMQRKNQRKDQSDQEKEMFNVNSRKTLSDKKTVTNSDYVISHEKDKPLEIIIKVKSDGQVKQCTKKRKSTVKTKTSKNSTTVNLIPNNVTEVILEPNTLTEQQYSYDSNSTSYKTLPPTLGQNVETEKEQSEKTNNFSVRSVHPVKPIHPIIAYYIQRLLGMTRKSVQDLSISSSDITTPPSSIINTPQNISAEALVDENLTNEERMKRVQNFIEDDRNFINELEETLRLHSNKSLETGIDALNKIWTRRLLESTKVRNLLVKCSKENSVKQAMKQVKPMKSNKFSKPIENGNSGVKIQLENRQSKNEQVLSKSFKEKSVAASDSSSIVPGCMESKKQMERYTKLTENCTQRISELTELINKVREEKQRLLEVTLTSASETGRNSTDYFELPGGKGAQQSGTLTDRSGSDHNDESTLSKTVTTDNEPLLKRKLIGTSHDSGICVSRPMTAQDQVLDGEVASVDSATQDHLLAQKKNKAPPPPTLRRFSPNMMEDNEAHELSTIIEVDTPAQSHINTTSVETSKRVVHIKPGEHQYQPVPFPTFEQYAQELNLDLSQISANQSIRLQQEFDELVKAIQQSLNNTVNYQEYPSISAYLYNMTATHFNIDAQQNVDTNSPHTIRELIQRLKIAKVNINTFPTHQEYMQKLSEKQVEERDNSILNKSDSETTDSFNVEAELKKRRLLKTSFKQTNASAEEYAASSTQRNSAAFFTGALPSESGIDKVSNSPSDSVSAEIEKELRQFGLHWPITMHQRQKKADALISDSSEFTTSSSNSTNRQRKLTSATTKRLNLREYLTRELLKQAKNTSSSSTDDSIKTIFIQSILDSLAVLDTPNTNNAAGTATCGTLDRQKTSTPVMSSQSTRSQNPNNQTSSDTTQLFSGESKLSSVHYRDKDHLKKT